MTSGTFNAYDLFDRDAPYIATVRWRFINELNDRWHVPKNFSAENVAKPRRALSHPNIERFRNARFFHLNFGRLKKKARGSELIKFNQSE